MKSPKKPCDDCKKKPNCPAICYPLKDWKRAMEKRGLKWDMPKTLKTS